MMSPLRGCAAFDDPTQALKGLATRRRPSGAILVNRFGTRYQLHFLLRPGLSNPAPLGLRVPHSQTQGCASLRPGLSNPAPLGLRSGPLLSVIASQTETKRCYSADILR